MSQLISEYIETTSGPIPAEDVPLVLRETIASKSHKQLVVFLVIITIILIFLAISYSHQYERHLRRELKKADVVAETDATLPQIPVAKRGAVAEAAKLRILSEFYPLPLQNVVVITKYNQAIDIPADFEMAVSKSASGNGTLYEVSLPEPVDIVEIVLLCDADTIIAGTGGRRMDLIDAVDITVIDQKGAVSWHGIERLEPTHQNSYRLYEVLAVNPGFSYEKLGYYGTAAETGAVNEDILAQKLRG